MQGFPPFFLFFLPFSPPQRTFFPFFLHIPEIMPYFAVLKHLRALGLPSSIGHLLTLLGGHFFCSSEELLRQGVYDKGGCLPTKVLALRSRALGCFSERGMAAVSLSITLKHPRAWKQHPSTWARGPQVLIKH